MKKLPKLPKLPKPSCPLGYTIADLEEMFTVEELEKFDDWMIGQTEAICQGWEYDYRLKKAVPDDCSDNPHGYVCYTWDVERFVAKRPIID